MLWTVNWSATAQGGSTAGRWSTVFSGSVTVTDGTNTLQTKSMSARIEQAKNNTVLLSGSFTVGTNSSGNRNLAFSGEFQFETTAASGKSSGSQTFALDTKAMASTISSVTSNVTVGSSGGSSTVSISRKSSSYTHTVVWTFGSNTHTETGVATSKSYTIPASWLATIPNAASGSATVKVTTFTGSTQIGQPATASFTITAGVSPTIGSVSVAQSGNPSGITQYVAGKTAAKITASSVAGVQGSTIKKVEFIRDGAVLSSNTTPTYTYTTGTLTGSSATFSVRVTDSRGATATKAASAITIHAYALPTISANAFRSNSSGTATADGTYIRITASATATPSSNSITALTYATKTATASSYSSEANIGSGVTKSGFANTTSYNVRITATDEFGSKAYKYFTIPTASYTMDFKVGGKGVAFGKVAETDNLVDSEWDIKTAGTVKTNADAHISASTSPTVMLECPLGTRLGDVALRTTATNGVQRPVNMVFRLYSYNSSTGARIGYYDVYQLPDATTDKTGNNGYTIITTKNISDIPDASASQRGLVSTGAQTFSGNKIFGNGLIAANSPRYPSIIIKASNDTDSGYAGTIYFDVGSSDANIHNHNRVAFEVRCAASANGAWSDFYEYYRLPATTNGRTNSPSYDILTSKSAVTVAQGGTGATTEAAARSNLGMTTVSLWSGTLSTTATTISNAYGAYSAYIIVGAPSGGAKASMVIPKVAITTSDVTWQLTDNSNYGSFKIHYSGTSIIITKVSGSGSITNVYGIAGA